MTLESDKLASLAARYLEAGRVVYGGEEPKGEALARAYKFWRQPGRRVRIEREGAAPAFESRGRPALEAVRLAMADDAAGRSRWPSSGGLASYGNQPMADGGQWIEDTAGAGLRFVGFADEIAKRYGSSRAIDNLGYYIREDGDGGEVYRAAVYQLPAVKGRPRYVPAIREGDSGRNGWRDMATGRDSGAAIVYLRDIELGERGGDEFERSAGYDAPAFAAARLADGRAERLAEKSRDYDTAWNRGREAGDSLEEARAARRDFLKLKAELRGRLPLFEGEEAPAIKQALCGQLRSLAREWREAKSKAAELVREWGDSYQSEAFREGLGG